ncbi:hypothetical protein BH24ACT11_BH24ACT11_04810 [soil metagenome]
MTTDKELRGWLIGRLQTDWFTDPVQISKDRDEIQVIGRVAAPDVADDASSDERRAAEQGRIRSFRESSRDRRIEIARELESRTGRKVAWGVECGASRQIFSSLAAPVMTRLRQRERLVLDTLVDSGVARSRSDALGWCVRLVQTNAESWLADLRTAMEQVEQVRAQGPTGAPSQRNE